MRIRSLSNIQLIFYVLLKEHLPPCVCNVIFEITINELKFWQQLRANFNIF